MKPPFRRIAIAVFAALLMVLAVQAGPASADVRCGHVKCAIQIKAERPSSVRMTWEQWFSPAEPLTKVEVLDRRTLALIEPFRTTDAREIHIHGVHDLCVELQVSAVRVAGAGARVAVTALVYDTGPGQPQLIAEQDLRPVTLASGATADLSETLNVNWNSQTFVVETDLRLSNTYVPFYG